MTLGQDIYQLIHNMIDTTVYSSAAGPDVDNYAKIIYQDPGLIAAIDNAIEKMQVTGIGGKESAIGGDGEFENALAELVNDDFNAIADDAMSDQEYSKFAENRAKSKPFLDPIGESQAVGLAKSGLGAAQRPFSLGVSAISMMPHAALLLLAVSLAPLIISELKRPGSTLDVRWRRIMQDEYNALMARQDQWNAQIGVRQVYVVSHDQFLIGNGAAMSESNLRRVRESDQRIADRIEFTDHAREFFK